jgi:hypothetical protein
MELNALQLTEVRNYVAQGWKNPDVQITVTDHIKYRLQELMDNDSTLSLHDALTLTHAEFGLQSFQVLEDNLKAGAKNKYSKLFLQMLVASFKVAYLVMAIAFIISVSWLFSTTQPVEVIKTISIVMPLITAFLPIYLVLFSMKFSQAKLYKTYHTMSMSNTVLFKWCIVPSALMSVLYFATNILILEQMFLLAGVCCSSMVLVGLLFIHAGYKVRKATIQECKEIEALLLIL